MRYGRPLLAAVGIALSVLGAGLALFGSAPAGALLLIVGLLAIVLAVHDWDEFTADFKNQKVSVSRPSPQTGPISIEAPPREPELEILSVKARGGHAGAVDFAGEVTNRGTKSCRATLEADVDGWPVTCRPSVLDLGPDSGPKSFDVLVARPALGDLVGAFNHETTLYGRTLHVRVSAGGQQVEDSWGEIVYGNGSNAERAATQRSLWHEGSDFHPEPLVVGMLRTRLCRRCDDVTRQTLTRHQIDGAGRSVTRSWRCLICGAEPA